MSLVVITTLMFLSVTTGFLIGCASPAPADSSRQRVSTHPPFNIRVSGWFAEEVLVTVRWQVPGKGAEGKDFYVYNAFIVRPGDMIGQKATAYTDEFKYNVLRDPKTKEPIQWDFSTGYKLVKIDKDVLITRDIRTLRYMCAPPFRYDREKNPDPKDRDCPGLTTVLDPEIRREVSLQVCKITCVDRERHDWQEFIDKWMEKSIITVPVDKPFLLCCPKHGGPRLPQ